MEKSDKFFVLGITPLLIIFVGAFLFFMYIMFDTLGYRFGYAIGGFLILVGWMCYFFNKGADAEKVEKAEAKEKMLEKAREKENA